MATNQLNADFFNTPAAYQHSLETKRYTNATILLSGSFRSKNTQRPGLTIRLLRTTLCLDVVTEFTRRVRYCCGERLWSLEGLRASDAER